MATRAPPFAAFTGRNVRRDVDRQRRRVRTVLAVVAVVMPLQFAVGYLLGEPWPTVAFPSFWGSPHQGSTVGVTESTIVVAFSGGGTEEMGKDDLFDQTEDLLGRSLLSSAFNRSSPPSLSEGGLRARASDLLTPPWFDHPPDPKGQTETRNWLRGRIADLFPGRDPERITVTWTDTRYPIEGGWVPESSEVVATVSTEL